MFQIKKIINFNQNDAIDMSKLIAKTLRQSNLGYNQKYVENTIEKLQPKMLLERSKWQHIYCCKNLTNWIGCGAIGPYYNELNHSCLFSIFVDPSFQKHGLGSKIVNALLLDEFATRANKITVHSSIAAVAFYKKFGFNYVNNNKKPTSNGHVVMEKFLSLN